MPRPTGFPAADVQNDFQRARRRQVLARLAHKLRREPDDVNLVLPFDEVVAALGNRGQHSIGLQTIKLDSIVGSVDTTRDFDRRFRPTSSRVRERWERLALAQTRGESIPPIDVYRVGDLHFIKDGHHRVSIAMVRDQDVIDAYVTVVRTVISSHGILHRADLLVKDHERMFRARVPLSSQQLVAIEVTDPWSYAELGEAVEAWGYRAMQHLGTFLDRTEIAGRWFSEEFTPVVRMLRSAELLGTRTDAEAYLAVAAERYRLIRTHDWTDEVIAHLGESPDFR